MLCPGQFWKKLLIIKVIINSDYFCQKVFENSFEILHYTTLHYTTLHYTTLHYTTLHYTTLHYTTLHYTTLHYTTLHYTTLHYTTPHYTTLHYTTLHYTTLHYTTRHDTSRHRTAPHRTTPHDTTLPWPYIFTSFRHISEPYPQHNFPRLPTQLISNKLKCRDNPNSSNHGTVEKRQFQC